MEDFKYKAIKYTVLLIVIFILQIVFPVILTSAGSLLDVVLPAKSFGLWFILFNYFLKSVFALILFLDCRKEIQNYLLVPLLCIFVPAVGLMFYFTAILFEIRKPIL
jgi:hypothetical protein